MKQIHTSESVNIGHPDKTCDTIADAFLDEALRQDPESQMAVECAIKNDKLFVYGEATTKANIDYEKIAKNILKDIGYKNEFTVIKEISIQSPDINNAVVKQELCANDQGMCFGYATNETPQFLPLGVVVSHDIMKVYEKYRQTTDCFFADAKSQVSVVYEDNVPLYIKKIVVSVSHISDLTLNDVQQKIQQNVLCKIQEKYKNYFNNQTDILINPSGKFTIWGSFGDSGCVGRKIVVDTYGGAGRVGGGCFSSKNATKVDRSAAYYARYVAKNIVANGFADKCEVEVCYAIGLNKPLALNIETFGTNKIELEKIYKIVDKNFDFSPQNIITELDLKKPIYKPTACYGHFGNNNYPWEKIKKLK